MIKGLADAAHGCSTGGGWSEGSCGAGATSPRYVVWRLNCISAWRNSPWADSADTVMVCSPSGNEQRQLKVLSGRSETGWPPMVTLAPGSVPP